MLVSWDDLACVDHYIIRLEKVGSAEMTEYGSEYGVAMYGNDSIADDDEDYHYEGSGSREFTTVRPKREMPEDSFLKIIKNEDTTSEGAVSTGSCLISSYL